MSVTLQALLLRWLPIAAIAITELVVFEPVRRAVARGDWAPIAAVAAFSVSLLLLGLRGLPNPNGRTVGGYLVRLAEFAVVFAPIAAIPGRYSGV